MTINKEASSPSNLVTLIQRKIRLEKVSEESINAIKAIGAQEGRLLAKSFGSSRMLMNAN
jgi:chemotaxis receptor (MCP) glutamine deamidase CheD